MGWPFLFNFPAVSFGESLCFRVFSPSKEPVSIKHIPSFNSESNNMRSAGKVKSFSTKTNSPISKFPLIVFSHFLLR